ncbi:family A G protein-coupled receptor-like protein [Coniochaeta ligniaria NRRL 30616]|uniref:Family A G protein-coupled receptor-like protein n=1 Tax=Coniochaeta ligniaria NRRL 30616 TaxID=1408157 RepID=A0A1J7J3K3_9PEZI|nr:family A G protein-coupled receptor-like protein [Coniochaeta ligniaria NRRL 30616]
MNLTVEQRRALQTVERVGASLSLVGVCLIFITFAAFKRLRTVPNTFILFASIANVGASTACLIGYDGLNAGYDSALCQVQGFLLEMFMQSDPWWSLAMAINVYMVFFLAANPTSFRQYLWIYCLVCYGAPALPAIILLLVRGDPRGPVYGNATLWCWIGDKWNSLRIFTYYIPIWVCILLSTIIYFAVGYQVFHQRNQLRNLTLSNPAKDTSSSDVRESGERTTYNGQPGCYGMVTTEVRVTAEPSISEGHITPPTTPTPSIAPVLPCKPATHHGHHPWASPSADDHPDFFDDLDLENDTHPTRSLSQRARKPTTASSTSGPIAPYTTITTNYTPPTTTRRHHPSPKTKRAGPSSRRRPWPTRLASGTRHFLTKLSNLDPVKLAYLRTSFVFAISILITWAPSSINRVYTLIYPSRFNFGLNMASAVVLPLQGVWNAVIYCATSWYVLVGEVAELRGRLWAGGGRRGQGGGMGVGVGVAFDGVDGGRRRGRGTRERGFELSPTPRVSTMRVVRGSF